jgi:7,8-dihydropterin-6-yl-methyl-4-(beta-D-ribofuranosyl)aminobenzene 5'-phosphate synthase
MRITVISDNKTLRRNLVGKHSLAILIEWDFTSIIFDMGIDEEVLEHNSRYLNVSVDIVDYAVVSHEHTPHYGGYRYIAREAPLTEVYIPYGSYESLGRMLLSSGLRPREVVKWTKLGNGIYVAGPYYGPPYEQLLVIEHEKGLVVLSGCLHPGLQVLRDITSRLQKRLYAIIGGFHLKNAPRDTLEKARDLLSELKPQLVVPLHCSGEVLIKELKEKGLNVIDGGAGLVFDL